MAEHMYGMETVSTSASSHSLSCGACGVANTLHRHFCRSCGEGLVCPCEACQFLNSLGDSFCGGCGADLEAKMQVPTSIRPPSGPRSAPRSGPRSAPPVKAGQRIRKGPPPLPTISPISPAVQLATRLKRINAQSALGGLQLQDGPETADDSQETDSNDLSQDQIDDLFS